MGVKEQLKELEVLVTNGLTLSYVKMMEMKRAKNSPIIVQERGKIMALRAGELQDQKSASI
jgi:hypothetical protein